MRWSDTCLAGATVWLPTGQWRLTPRVQHWATLHLRIQVTREAHEAPHMTRMRNRLKRRTSGVFIQSCDIVRVFSRPTRSPISTHRPSATLAPPSSTPPTLPTCREDALRPWLDRLYQRLNDAEGESKVNL